MTIRRTTLAAAAAAVLTLVAPAGAAFADSYTTDDARHDVRQTSDLGSAAVPDRSQGDVTRFLVDYASRQVRFTQQYAALSTPGPNDFAYHEFVVATNDGHRYKLLVATTQMEPQGEIVFSRDGSTTDCAGVRATVDYTHRRVVATIPGSCLGTPRWVRGGASATLGEYLTPAPGVRVFRDDASLDGALGNETAITGPRLRDRRG